MMKKNLVLLATIVFMVQSLFSQHDNLIVNVRDHVTTNLSGKWRYLTDVNQESRGYEHNRVPIKKWDLHEYNFPTSDWLYVPGDWNTQREELFYYEGHVWYQKNFTYKLPENKRLFIYFGAVNYKAEVYLNGVLLGKHVGGFTPFNFEIADSILKEENSLVVLADNTRDYDGVPSFRTGWWNYGGITRDVMLVEVNNTFVRDYKVQLENNNPNLIEGFVKLDGQLPRQRVSVSIPGLKQKYTGKTNQEGYVEFTFKAGDIVHWDVDNPKLYDVYIESETDTVHDKIGFRTIETKGTDILLNGKSIFLRGISIHEENPLGRGRAWSEEHARILLQRAKDLSCNFVRLAHYPHNEYMYRVADEMGMLVWEELPLFWAINWESENAYKIAENMATAMVARDKNRASIIIWSVANETGSNEPRNIFLTEMIEHTKKMDDTRLISAALFVNKEKSTKHHKIVDDYLGKFADVISVNEYFGWYQGLPQLKDSISWEIKFDKPFVFSETGAGALQGYHGDSLTRWTEDYQSYYFRETIEMIEKIPSLRGLSPWILNDFLSPQRVFPYIQDNFLRKGLVSDRGEKKEAFYILKSYYQMKKENFGKEN